MKTLLLLIGFVLASIHFAGAQQPGKLYRVGFLLGGSSSVYSARIDVFREQLKELGYIEGKNIAIEYRIAEGNVDRLPALAAELVDLKMDVIVTSATPDTLAVRKASATIPIVFASISDPVGSGLVASLARPGGNSTGLTILAPELSGKRLELLKDAVPNLTRVVILWNAANPAQELQWKEMKAAAQELRLQIQSLEVRSSNDFDSAFEVGLRGRPQALIATPEPLINTQLRRIVGFAAKNRLPAVQVAITGAIGH